MANPKRIAFKHWHRSKRTPWYKILIWSRFTHLTNTYTHLSVYLNKDRFNLTYLYLVPITMNFLTTYLIYEILVFSRLRKHTSNKDRKGSNYIVITHMTIDFFACQLHYR